MNLIKVKTINAKIAKQIVTITYDPQPTSDHHRIATALAEGTLTPVGWVNRSQIDGQHRSYHDYRYWLIQEGVQLRWFSAPTGGKLAEKYKDLEQLFV